MLSKPKKLSKKSGVYLFKDPQGKILYIGKATNLASRINSYFANPDDFKNSLILQEAASIETILTNSEEQAAYLEVDLVKKYQPKFNQLLKEGNPFVYLFFSQEKMPQLSVVRVFAKQKKGTYVGPFLSKKVARAVHHFLVTTFRLKLCKKKIEHGCLQYHIGICAGFCGPDFDENFYLFRLELVKQLLSKDPKKALKILDQEIAKASKKLEFEKAQHLLEYKNNFEQFLATLQRLKEMPTLSKTLDQEKNLPLLFALQKRFKLKQVPYVIDCFDISHMQGRAIVGSCIRYVNGQPDSKSFRRFRVNSLIDQDDYAALAEIVSRRYKTKNNYPNLVIVDGGKGQINAIKALVGDADLVGLAKREETIISSNFSSFIKLDHTKPEDALILQIRDKTHDFAVSYHRKKMKIIN